MSPLSSAVLDLSDLKLCAGRRDPKATETPPFEFLRERCTFPFQARPSFESGARGVLVRRGRQAVPEEGAFPAGDRDAHDQCTWHSFAEPPARGMPGKRWEGRFQAAHPETHWPSPRGHSHCRE
ncbi:hypothetical protein NN561_004194 [Cricetulus griseus]